MESQMNNRHFESPNSRREAQRELQSIAMELQYLASDDECNPEDIDNLNERAEYLRAWLAGRAE
jgi:DNA repair ATPase RecN